MHTPDNPQMYLNRNFYCEYSFSGVPFLDGRCSADSTNLIIYGHHMNNGTMFSDLCNYTSSSYRDEHKAVVLETKDGVSAYTVFAVLKVKSDDEWYRFTSALTKTGTILWLNTQKKNLFMKQVSHQNTVSRY